MYILSYKTISRFFTRHTYPLVQLIQQMQIALTQEQPRTPTIFATFCVFDKIAIGTDYAQTPYLLLPCKLTQMFHFKSTV